MQPNERTKPEALTIAYLAMGAQNAIRTMPGKHLPDRVADAYQGEMNFIEAVTDHALLLDRMADLLDQGDGLAGVFLYEIAEPFGEEYARQLIAETTTENGQPAIDPHALAARLFAEMARAGSCRDCVVL